MRITFLYSLLFIFLLRSNSSAQSARDLHEKATHQKNDTGKVLALIGLSEFYGEEAADSIIKYSERAIKVWEALHDELKASRRGLIIKTEALNNLAFGLDSKQQPMKALSIYNDVLTVVEKIDDKKGMSNAYNNMGTIYHNQGNITKALDCFVKCLRLEEMLGGAGNGSAECLNNIGLLYSTQGDHKTALEYYEKSLAEEMKQNDKEGIASSLNIIAAEHFEMGDMKQAIQYCNRGLQISRDAGDDIGIAVALNSLSNFHQRDKQTEKAYSLLLESKEILEKTDYKTGLATVLGNLGRLDLEAGRLQRAGPLLERSFALAKELHNVHQIRTTALELSKYFEKTGQQRKALEMYKLHIQMRDSIRNEGTRKASIRQQLKYEYEKQIAADSIAHARESELKNAELAKQAVILKAKKNQQYALFGGLILVILFSVFIFNRFKLTQKQKLVIESQKKLVEEQKELVDQKQKELLDSIHYAQRIQQAHLPHDSKFEKATRKK